MEKRLLDACRRGHVKEVRSLVSSGKTSPELRERALRVAAEYGQSQCFQVVIQAHSRPSDDTLLHAMKWALRYDDRNLYASVLEADAGRWIVTREQLDELRRLESRRVKPDRAIIYLIDRVLTVAAESTPVSA